MKLAYLLSLFCLNAYAQVELLPCTEGLNSLECKIYQETNRTRLEHGLQQLEILEQCQQAAIYHTESMAESGVYAHEIRGYKSFPERMNSFRVPGKHLAENIHHRDTSRFKDEDEAAREIVADWYNSKGHRKNMMNRSFTSMGIAAFDDYQVQCFSDAAIHSSSAVEKPKAERRNPLRGIFGGLSIRGVFGGSK